MKVIFLDIDGVLNCVSTERKINGILFVDCDKIALLSKIIKATDAKIVLSSTWRFGKILNIGTAEYAALENELALSGIKIMDCTPRITSGYRGHEIQFWLHCWNDNHEENQVDQFVILDDDNDMEPFMEHLVQTTFEYGLTSKETEEAINVLNGSISALKDKQSKNTGGHRQTFKEMN